MDTRSRTRKKEKPVQVIRGRNAPKVFPLVALVFMLAGYTNIYRTALFNFDMSTRTLVDILASLVVTFAFVFWAVRAFFARIELHEDRIVYRGIQRHLVLSIAAIENLYEDSGPSASLFLGTEERCVILGAFEFHRADIDRVREFVEQKAQEQGRALGTEKRRFAWMLKQHYWQWPPDYLGTVSLVAIIWLVLFQQEAPFRY